MSCFKCLPSCITKYQSLSIRQTILVDKPLWVTNTLIRSHRQSMTRWFYWIRLDWTRIYLFQLKNWICFDNVNIIYFSSIVIKHDRVIQIHPLHQYTIRYTTQTHPLETYSCYLLIHVFLDVIIWLQSLNIRHFTP